MERRPRKPDECTCLVRVCSEETVEVTGDVAEEGHERGTELSGTHGGKLGTVDGSHTLAERQGPFDRTPRASLVDDRDDVYVEERGDVAVEGGLWDIRERVAQLRCRQRKSMSTYKST